MLLQEKETGEERKLPKAKRVKLGSPKPKCGGSADETRAANRKAMGSY